MDSKRTVCCYAKHLPGAVHFAFLLAAFFVFAFDQYLNVVEGECRAARRKLLTYQDF